MPLSRMDVERMDVEDGVLDKSDFVSVLKRKTGLNAPKRQKRLVEWSLDDSLNSAQKRS